MTLMLAGRNGARGRMRTCTGDALDVVGGRVQNACWLDYASGNQLMVEGGKAIPRGSWSLNNQLSTINQHKKRRPVSSRPNKPAGFWWLPFGCRFTLRL